MTVPYDTGSFYDDAYVTYDGVVSRFSRDEGEFLDDFGKPVSPIKAKHERHERIAQRQGYTTR